MNVKRQCGRSLVEIMGILAIVALLTIIGLNVYKSLITKNDTNNLIEDVREAGFIVVDTLFEKLPEEDVGLDISDNFTRKTSYGFHAFGETEETFEILVENVPYNVCEETKKREVEWLEEIKANGFLDVCEKEMGNQVSFFFNRDLDGNTELDSPECRTGEDCPLSLPYCFEGYCSECAQDSHCMDSRPYCRDGFCVECSELQQTNGTCVACPALSSWVYNVTKEDCHSICGNRYFFTAGLKSCNGCNSSNPYDKKTTFEECTRCPNRYFKPDTQECPLCGAEQHQSEDGLSCEYSYCTSDADCADVEGLPSCRGGKCVKCPELQLTNGGCDVCPALNGWTPYTTKGSCHDGCGDNYFFTTGLKSCNGCKSSNPYDKKTTLEECKRCPNRYFKQDTQECLLCGSEQHQSEDGLSCEYSYCTSDADCADVEGLPSCRGGKCVKCPELQLTNGGCDVCPALNGWTPYTTKGSCHDGCGDNYFFTTGLKSCNGCKSSNPYDKKTTLEECKRCPNRYFKQDTQECLLCGSEQHQSADGLSCEYSYCTSDADCADVEGLPSCRGGKCVKCPELQLTNGGCDVCPALNAWTPYTTKGSCHDGCGDNYFFTTGLSSCNGCNSSNPYDKKTTLEECKRCPNRYFKQDTQECLLCGSGKKVTEDGLYCIPERCSSDDDCVHVTDQPYCRNGTCVKCPELSKSDGSCVSCPANNLWQNGVTKESCHDACGDNYFFTTVNRTCNGCDAVSPHDKKTTLEECKRCPNRYFDPNTNECHYCGSERRRTDDGLGCQ